MNRVIKLIKEKGIQYILKKIIKKISKKIIISITKNIKKISGNYKNII